MKCEIIRDLLPLYIDGLTSKESNQEIEKHLKNCEECQKYYQEMTGDIDNFSVITNEEIEDVNLIKKIKKKNRKKALGWRKPQLESSHLNKPAYRSENGKEKKNYCKSNDKHKE